MVKKLTHECLNCHGTGWYYKEKKWGCFRCGGLQYPSRQGTGIDPLSNALCILDSVFLDWITLNDAVIRTMQLTGWTRKLVVDYLNWMYTQGFIVVQDGKAIDHTKIEEDEPSAI